ncbi:MAG TPA: SMR family transporter [Jatrophihabitans sp.]|nr:SMR family transporter [Jatrophihabitans sp.]
MRRAWPLLGAAVLTEVAATLALKGSLRHPAWYLFVVAGYLSAFALLAGVLRRGVPLGVAYGVWGACGVILTAVLGSLLYGERLTAVTALGMALIIGGVLVVEVERPR